MKRLFSVLVISLIAFVAFGFMACNENSQHEHTYKWEVVNQPSCSEEGLANGTCTKCGETTTRAIDKMPHTYGEWQTTRESTCSKEGEQKRTCTVCGFDDVQPLEKAAHTPDLVEGVKPTCKDEGVSDCFQCKVCGKFSATLNGDFTFNTKEEVQTVVPTIEHTYGEWTEIEAATCEKEGSHRRVCSVCGYVDIEPIPLADHTFEDYIVTKAPTCSEYGEKECVCSVCGHKETQRVEKADHVVEVIAGKDPTCTEDGYTTSTRCRECNEVVQPAEKIDALGHDWPLYWKEKEEGTHAHYCLVCGAEETADCELNVLHSDPTCTEDGYNRVLCRICGYQKDFVLDKLGHDYEGSSYVEQIEYTDVQLTASGDVTGAHVHKHYRVCRHGCGATEVSECEFGDTVSVEPTCTVAGYNYQVCKDCGSVHETETTPATGHQAESDKYVIEGNKITSAYHAKVCAKCGEMFEMVQHVYTTVEVPATCTTDGYRYNECEVCKFKTPTENLVAPLKHDFGDWTYDGDDSYDDNDHHHKRTCTRCDYFETEKCNIVSSTTVPTCTTDGKTHNVCEVCKVSFDNGHAESLGHKWAEEGEGWKATDDNICTRTCTVCKTTETQNHSFTEAVTPATCTTVAVTVKTCTHCGKEVKEESEDKALGHKYEEQYNITTGTHSRTCSVCHQEATENHDFSESNICVCGYDGLTYKIEGEHCYVTSDEKVHNSKKIVIRPYYTPLTNSEPVLLDAEGQTKTAQSYKVTKIDANAFIYHKNMTSVELPYTLEEICKNAFMNCMSLVNVTINDYAEPEQVEQPEQSEQPEGASLVASSDEVADGEPEEKADDHSTKLSKIGDYAFYYCVLLESFEAPQSLTSIGSWAFGSCSKLSEIDLGENITEIGKYAFSGTKCAKEGDNFENGIFYVGNYVIGASADRQEFDIKDGTTTIAASAFANCPSMTKVTLPDSIKQIDADAFKGCTKLNEVVYEGDFNGWFKINFENDYSSPMHYASNLNLQKTDGDVKIPEGVTMIPAGTFAGTNIEKVTIPASVTYIGARAFYDCKGLKEIVFESDEENKHKDGNQITYVGKDAYAGSAYYTNDEHWKEGMLVIGSSLIATKPAEIKEEVNLRDSGIVTICEEAFKDCTSLKKLSLPITLERIGANVINGCSALTDVTFNCKHTWFAWGTIISRTVKYADISTPNGARDRLVANPGEWYIYERNDEPVPDPEGSETDQGEAEESDHQENHPEEGQD